METSTGWTAQLRERVKERVADLACEGDRKGSQGPAAAAEIGIAYSTLWRFLEGNGLYSESIDKIMVWLES